MANSKRYRKNRSYVRPEPLMTVDEAAQLLNIPSGLMSFLSLANRGPVQVIKPDGEIGYRFQELIHWSKSILVDRGSDRITKAAWLKLVSKQLFK